MNTIKVQEFKLTLVRSEEVTISQERLVSPESVYNFLMKFYNQDDDMLVREYFYVLYINNNQSIVGTSILSMGGMTGTIVDVRLLFSGALLIGATAIIIAHNHPSGKLEPSQADINLTKKIKEASLLLDIDLIDHIIVTDKGYYSFSENNS